MSIAARVAPEKVVTSYHHAACNIRTVGDETMRVCSVEGCNGEHKGYGLCSKHYQRLKRLGSIDDPLPTLEEKLAARSKRVGECLEWTGTFYGSGYGNLHHDGRKQSVHRLAYTDEYGTIPEGLLVCHKCDNRKCIEPTHLFLGTHKENSEDMVAKGRQTSGERNAMAKFTDKDVVEIKSLLAAGAVQRRIAEKFNVPYQSISAIHRGKIWTHI